MIIPGPHPFICLTWPGMLREGKPHVIFSLFLKSSNVQFSIFRASKIWPLCFTWQYVYTLRGHFCLGLFIWTCWALTKYRHSYEWPLAFRSLTAKLKMLPYYPFLSARIIFYIKCLPRDYLYMLTGTIFEYTMLKANFSRSQEMT